MSGYPTIEQLGLARDEQFVTRILVAAMNENQTFLSRLVASVTGTPIRGNDWHVFRQRGPGNASGRAGLLPDITIASNHERRGILAEIKVLALEGDGQTPKYSAPENQRRLEENLNLPVCNWACIYVTPDKAEADSASSFKAMSLSEVVRLLPEDGFQNPGIALLCRELVALTREYDARSPPDPSENLHAYLQKRKGFVDPVENFNQWVSERLPVPTGFSISDEVDITSNRGCGRIPFIQFSRPTWKGKEFLDTGTDARNLDGSDCFDVHAEIQFNEVEEELVLRLDYHVNAHNYVGTDEFNTLARSFRERYAARRALVFEQLLRHEMKLTVAGWNLKKTATRLAIWIAPSGSSVAQVNEKVRELLVVIGPIVDEALAMTT